MKFALFILSVILIPFILAECEIARAADITFDESVAGKMVVEIEQCRIMEDQIELYKESNAELEYQIKLQKDINNLQKEQLEVTKEAVKQYQELLKIQEDVYKQVIKDTKPNPIKKFIDSLGFVGIGVLIGVLAL